MKINHILIALVLIISALFIDSDKSTTIWAGAEVEIYVLLTATMMSLIINNYFKNDFLLLLNFYFVVFYLLRIPIVSTDFFISDVVTRNVDAGSIPWAITILIIQYIMLVTSIVIINPKLRRPRANDLSQACVKKVIKYVWIIFIPNLFALFFFELGGDPPFFIIKIFLTIFQTYSALAILTLAVVLANAKVLKEYKYQIIILYVSFILSVVFQGSKSAVFQIFLSLLIIIISVYGSSWRIRFLHLAMGCVALLLAVVIFIAGQSMRDVHRGLYGLDDAYNIALKKNDTWKMPVAFISYRIGFLDFFIDKVTNPVYHPVVSMEYMSKAIIDKITPGFDIFGTPFMSRAIYSAYHGQSSEGTNSEQITLFAESHLLFGFGSIFVYVLVCFLLKIAIQKYQPNYRFGQYIYNYFLIAIFYGYINSFGLDMFLTLDILYSGIFTLFSIWYLRLKEPPLRSAPPKFPYKSCTSELNPPIFNP